MPLLISILRSTGALRIIAVLWWAIEVFANVREGHVSADFTISLELLIVTLIACWAVWTWQQGSAKCIEAACAILAVGGLVLVLDFSLLSLAGFVLLGAAFVQIRTHIGFDRLGKVWFEGTAAPSYSPAPPPAQPQQTPQPQRPVTPGAPVQAAAAEANRYSDNMRAARYSFADIVGMAETKRRLRAAADDILAGGQDARNGMLLHGEPGNGKTMFAEALAGELKVPFFSIAYGDVASKWINETPQNIKAVFQAARQIGHGVLFIDEIDSFLKSRNSDNGHAMNQDTTNVMLTEIVALRGSKIVLIAATNLRDQMDAAGIREGRFDFQIEVPPPDQEAREALIRRGVLQTFESVDTGTLTSLARRWEGFSAARLTALGKQLKEMRRDGTIGEDAEFSVEVGMQALRLLQGRRGRLPERVKSIDDIIMPAASRDALKQLAFRLQNLENLEKINGKIPPGLIFWGPPGTGKTMAGMALAKQSGFAFVSITGAEIMARPGAWDQLVREARDIRPCIVFLDEADDILRDRRQSHVGTLTNKILTTLDGSAGRTPDVIFVAATNHYDLLDPAVVRGGRFELKVAFDVPQPQDMAIYVNQAILRHAEAGYVIPEEVVSLLCARLEGHSIADADAVIQAMIDQAGIRRLQEGTLDVRAEDVDAAAAAVHGMV